MISIILPAPAKINLFLRITGRRSDGYHNLQTLFQLLDYGDELKITACKNPDIVLTSSLDDVPSEENLVVRAAHALKKATNCSWGCEIQLEKKLPMGAGLGGGSSNAATALLGLNLLWQCGLSNEQLARIGEKLGADIPVFIYGKSAVAEGIGDQLTPIELPEAWYLVVTPQIKVSTEEIFSHPQLTRNSPPIKIRALLEAQYRNDCQAVVESLYPQVKDVLQWLQRFENPLITGTGASAFCRFNNESSALQAQAQVPKQWSAFVARGSNLSTLHRQLEKI
jgi:4-diphosphocytidyl-2-C-methyl-D-erythritol kinase